MPWDFCFVSQERVGELAIGVGIGVQNRALGQSLKKGEKNEAYFNRKSDYSFLEYTLAYDPSPISSTAFPFLMCSVVADTSNPQTMKLDLIVPPNKTLLPLLEGKS